MKVKNPMMSVEARGGIAGLVFNTWRGINYVKTNTSPTGQGSTKRLAAQALMASTSALWKGITETLRNGWRQYAQDHPITDWTGAPRHNTGFNWFVSCQIHLQLLGLAVNTAVPTTSPPAAVTGLTLGYSTTAIRMSTTTATYSTLSYLVKGVGPHSAGHVGKREEALVLGHWSCSTTQPIVTYASPSSGRYTQFVTIIDHANGLESTEQSAYVDVP